MPRRPQDPTPELRPREHGAYAMLAFPLASGLILGGPSLAGVAFASVVTAGFLAHEAGLVLLGRRGERLRAAGAAAARRRLAVLGAFALLSGGVYAAAAPAPALPWVLPAACLGLAVMGLAVATGTKSLAGELVVAAAFASVHAPLAAAGLGERAGEELLRVLLPALVWAASFGLATLAVHAVKARFQAVRRDGGAAPRWTVLLAPLAAAGVLGGAALTAAFGHPQAAIARALLPKAILVLALGALQVHPRHLKRVGWSLVAADALTLVLLGEALLHEGRP